MIAGSKAAASQRFLAHRAVLVALLAALSSPLAADEPTFTRDVDLIYHKQGGYALTMDRVAPAGNANGAAVVLVVSGRWVSRHDFLAPQVPDQLPRVATGGILNPTELLARGYSVFYVVHGAEPLFTIPEIHAHVSAAVRHIRHNGEGYGIDPSRIGIMGGSAGGHLALLQGTRGSPGREDPETQADESSRVQAVVAYFPPTDFVNFGVDGRFFIDYLAEQATPDGANNFLQALDLVEHDEESFVRNRVTDEGRLARHYRDIAPYYHVSAENPPTLLIHGDADDPRSGLEIDRTAFAEHQNAFLLPVHRFRYLAKPAGVHRPGVALGLCGGPAEVRPILATTVADRKGGG